MRVTHEENAETNRAPAYTTEQTYRMIKHGTHIQSLIKMEEADQLADNIVRISEFLRLNHQEVCTEFARTRTAGSHIAAMRHISTAITYSLRLLEDPAAWDERLRALGDRHLEMDVHRSLNRLFLNSLLAVLGTYIVESQYT